MRLLQTSNNEVSRRERKVQQQQRRRRRSGGKRSSSVKTREKASSTEAHRMTGWLHLCRRRGSEEEDVLRQGSG